jgi:hypothetical protein
MPTRQHDFKTQGVGGLGLSVVMRHQAHNSPVRTYTLSADSLHPGKSSRLLLPVVGAGIVFTGEG